MSFISNLELRQNPVEGAFSIAPYLGEEYRRQITKQASNTLLTQFVVDKTTWRSRSARKNRTHPVPVLPAYVERGEETADRRVFVSRCSFCDPCPGTTDWVKGEESIRSLFH
jgi:hypothetical protein